MGVTDYDRSLAWYRDVLGFDLEYELKEYGWCELKTPFGFNIGLGQTEKVTPGNVTPTFGVRDIEAAIAHLREHDVNVEDWHEIPEMVRLSTFYDPTARRGCSPRRSTPKEERHERSGTSARTRRSRASSRARTSSTTRRIARLGDRFRARPGGTGFHAKFRVARSGRSARRATRTSSAS